MFLLIAAVLLSSCAPDTVSRDLSALRMDVAKGGLLVGSQIEISVSKVSGGEKGRISFSVTSDDPGIIESMEGEKTGNGSIRIAFGKAGVVKVTATEEETGLKVEENLTINEKQYKPIETPDKEETPETPETPEVPEVPEVPDKEEGDEAPLPTGPWKLHFTSVPFVDGNGVERGIEDGDNILLMVQYKDGSEGLFVATPNPDGTLVLFDEDLRYADPRLDYADAVMGILNADYELKGGKFTRKSASSFEVPGENHEGQRDIHIAIGVFDEKTSTIELPFSRPMGHLVINARPHSRIRLNMKGFSPVESLFDDGVDSDYSQPVLVPSSGEIHLFGEWNESSLVQVIYQVHSELHALDTFNIGNYEKEILHEVDATYDFPSIRIPDGFVQADIPGLNPGDKINNSYLFTSVYDKLFPGTVDQTGTNMCWAASSSQMLNWWMWNNERKGIFDRDDRNPELDFPSSQYVARATAIFNWIFRDNFMDGGAAADQGLRWFISGTMNLFMKGRLLYDAVSPEGGWYRENGNMDDLVWKFSENYQGLESRDMEKGRRRYEDMSMEIYSNLLKGRPLIISDGGHAFMIWGASFSNGLVTDLYVTDSAATYVFEDPYYPGYHDYRQEDRGRRTQRIGFVSVELRDDAGIHISAYDPTGESVMVTDAILSDLFTVYEDFAEESMF